MPETTTCCVAGCGPAGAMLGLMLARAGVETLVLEKHADFLRDFRGDTIHPSTLQILDELGLFERFMALGPSKTEAISFQSDGGLDLSVDFKELPTRFPYIAFIPQWDFLEFVTAEAARYPTFRLIRKAEVVDVIEERGVVRGVRYNTPDGRTHDVHAFLTVAADGRGSRVREAAGLEPVATSPAIDVLWFRLPFGAGVHVHTAGRVADGHLVVVIDRGDYAQIGYLIAKGGIEAVHAEGLEAFRRSVARLVPELADRVGELRDWDQVKLLTVRSDRLRRWYRPGLLVIGDAAHAMTPVGGVGINFAVQDAVTAANELAEPLRRGRLSTRDLARVQAQRAWPAILMQLFQAAVQGVVFEPLLASRRPFTVPPWAHALLRLPAVRRIPPRIVGLGFAVPHVRTREMAPARHPV